MAKQLKEIEIPFGAKDSELCGWEYTIPEGMEATIVDNKIVVKKKESEDERIKKEIVRFIQMEAEDEIVGNKWIAWLEKQGEHANFLKKIQIGDKVTRNKDGMLMNLSQLNRVAKKYEKQGEQKPADKVEPKFKIGDYVKNVNDKREPIYEIVYMDKECYICEYRGKERMGDKAVMHFAFDNPYLRLVEPKFKIEKDKWYVCISQYCNCIEGRNYKASADGRIIDDYGTEYDMHDNAYKWFRPWTIQDAKDGDVLTTDTWTFIFKKYQDKSAYYHCAASTFNDFSISDTGEFDSNCVHPATKEQRDILFAKMKEAGYEWDSEKKELKKIEQKLSWSEEDRDYYDAIIAKLELTRYDALLTDNQMAFLKSLKERYTWKPSDAQIASLTIACDRNDRVGFDLTQLLKELKKL